MLRRVSALASLTISLAVALSGCGPQQPFFLHETGDLSKYRGMATEIEYPDANVDTLPDVQNSSAPLTLSKPEPREIWNLSLQEAVQTALTNGKVMKQIGAAVVAVAGGTGPGAPEFLIRNFRSAPTIYDPALVESDPRFGVEAALSAFDAHWKMSMTGAKVDQPQNYDSQVSPLFPNTNIGESAAFQNRIQKTNATGGTAALTGNVNYLNSNSPTRQFPSSYDVNMEAEVRQPLLAGAGVEFNRIAGPGAFPGYNAGVMIARVNTDIALASFEANVRNMVSEVENAYWELYFTYRSLDAVLAGRNSALTTWRKIYALYEFQSKGGEADKEAQAREQYFLFRTNVERALSALYKAESNLRYLMGIAATDGRLIRPTDEPTTAKVEFDWASIHSEAMVRSAELREQRWNVKRRELELIAAKNYLLPQLDLVARYRWLGLGHELISNDQTSTDPRAFAVNNLLYGKTQEWTAGMEFDMPLGFRRGMTTVRNAEVQLTREKALLQESELELSHQLTFAVRDMDANLTLAQSNFNRRVAAQRQVDAVQSAYDTGTVTIDVLLNAQRQLAQAESDFFRSVIDYNKSITQVHLRKGSLLEYNGVYLAEGPWPAKAYFDAQRIARSRDAGHYIDYGVTRPGVVSRGSYTQHMGGSTLIPQAAIGNTPQPNAEQVPPPAATPNTEAPTTQPKTAPESPKTPVLPPSTTTNSPTPAVQGASFVAATPAGAAAVQDSKITTSSRKAWVSPVKKSSNESNANPSSASADRAPANGN